MRLPAILVTLALGATVTGCTTSQVVDRSFPDVTKAICQMSDTLQRDIWREGGKVGATTNVTPTGRFTLHMQDVYMSGPNCPSATVEAKSCGANKTKVAIRIMSVNSTASLGKSRRRDLEKQRLIDLREFLEAKQ
jgi:hypothetical protein